VAFRPILCAALFSAAVVAIVVAPTMAKGPEVEQVRLFDKCDPNGFPAGLCASTSRGEVSLTQLLNFLGAHTQQVLRDREALGWSYAPKEAHLKAGTTFRVTNFGGEVHTFTDVTADHFTTGGCVALLNKVLGLQPNSICKGVDETSGAAFGALLGANGAVAPGPANAREFALAERSGTALFQCLIHPWMRLSVRVDSD
jgi:hypothetical protein